MTPTQIEAALSAGIITDKQARAMQADVAKGAPPPQTKAVIGAEDEMRFLRSFSDVFIGIGLLLLGAGLAALRGMIGGLLGYSLVIAVVYIMAEYFGRRKRAHFPTLILSLLFLWFVQGVTQSFVGGIIGTVIAVAAMAGFYWRIRLPFVVALIAVTIVYLVLALLGQIAPDLLRARFGLVLAVMGMMIFATALLYDVNDTQRQTRFADNAFWLHLLAAPMMVHGLAFTAVSTKAEMLFNIIPVITVERHEAVLILCLVTVICLIGLAINRRALIVSSLGYAMFALVYLAVGTGLEIGTSLIGALLLLGLGIVLLGVAWHPLRNQMIRFLPKWRVFPPPFLEA